MKRICLLIMGMFFLLGTTIAGAADPTSVLTSQTTTITTRYNGLGIAISSTSTTTTVTETTDAENKKTTTTSTTIVESTYRNGSLKTSSITSTSSTKDASNNVLSYSTYTDTYIYTNDVLSVSGSGTSWNKDVATGRYTSSDISRTFGSIKNGQALLTNMTSNGTTWDKEAKGDGQGEIPRKVLAKSQNITAIDVANAGYVYLGGQWVVYKETSTSNSENTDGSWEQTIELTTYNRDDNGTITGTKDADGKITTAGITKSATGGSKKDVESTVNNNGTPVEKVDYFTSYNIVATPVFDTTDGWHFSTDTSSWTHTETAITKPFSALTGDPTT